MASNQTAPVVRHHPLGDASLRVIDGLFDQPLIRMVHHFLSHLTFGLADYDTDATRHLLHWVHEFDAATLPDVPPLRALAERTIEVTRELHLSETLELKRIHCNAHLYGDMQHVHQDIVPGVTALYYANPRWEADWMGETLFCDPDGEPIYAVAPRPGRLVVFDGEVPHRGGVPSRCCGEPRLSLAFKFFRSGSDAGSR
jgi:Rps23 Pro-64 3,4-dihydroxylase Tpa1-like proline 4-hydroxylase